MLARFVAFVSVLAVLTASLVAGQRYFYCAAMDRIAADDCCTHDDDAHDAVATVDAPAHRCCEARAFDRGDRGAGGTGLVVVAPPLATPIALVELAPRSASLPRTTTETLPHERAGPIGWRTVIDVSLT